LLSVPPKPTGEGLRGFLGRLWGTNG
jgi:hypothetical protein